MKYFIQTFGCQMNVHDSERMAGMLDSLGYAPTNQPEDASVILMNTCAVRERPEHKLYSELGDLRRLKASNPNLVIGVAGCMAQREADNIRRRVPEVDILLGPRNLHHLPHLLRNVQNSSSQSDGFHDGLDLECDPTPVTPVRRSSAIAAYVDVIFGCNFNCTYCAVPSARGREVSRRPSEILDEVRQLRDLGYREITLLGQTVNAYGHDLGKVENYRINFAWLLREIDKIDSQLRVRYTSPHPMYFNDELIDTIASTRSVCEHLHMPLQSGDNNCLRRMKRTYTVEKYRGIVEKVRERIPHVAVTTDCIVGFCGETEAEFENTMMAFREIRFDNAFMFAYSPRHTTVAWDWTDDVRSEEKSERLARLIDLQREISRAVNEERLGESVEVLVESTSQKDGTKLSGRTRQNKLVAFEGDLSSTPPGSLVEVRTSGAYLWGFSGEMKRVLRSSAPRLTLELTAA